MPKDTRALIVTTWNSRLDVCLMLGGAYQRCGVLPLVTKAHPARQEITFGSLVRLMTRAVKLTAFLAVAGSVSVLPAVADDLDTCKRASGEEAIAACTRAIDSGRWRGPGLARAYNNRATAYYGDGGYEHAIADYNEAIRLDPKYPFAYNNLGNAHRANGEYDCAIANYSDAIRLDPKYVAAYINRGNAYYSNGDKRRAIADYNEAIRLDPKSAYAYRERSLTHFYGGTFAQALADISQASKLAQKDPYNALWVEIVGQRNNAPSRLSQAISKIDMSAWPAPVIRMFLGQMPPADVLAAAEHPDATKRKGRVCEANFYSGELALRTGAKDEAGRLFRLAASDCPKTFEERDAAEAELKALGIVP
jgi:lipoprotein NlpI